MSTSSQLDMYFTYDIKDGCDGLFQQYLDSVLGKTESEEPYVLEYELFRRQDGSFLQHERYRDEAAVYRHLEVTAEGQKAWGESTELTSLVIVGEASERFWEQFDGPHVDRYARFREILR